MIRDIASVATALGVLAAVFGLRQGQRHRIRQFEDFYVLRYWGLMDQLSLSAMIGNNDREPLGAEDEKAIRSYLVLCEDELDLRAEGWISDATWKIWSQGITNQLQRWPVCHVWDMIKREVAEGRAQPFQRLIEFTANGSQDPFDNGRWWTRRVRGLRGWITP